MSSESAFIASLRALASDGAARGLLDDAAVLPFGGERMVLTKDAIVEGVHFLPDDPPGSVAWKLVAANVSDLAAKGATPLGCLLAYSLAGDPAWDAAFVEGLSEACRHFAIPLLGGDTVRAPADNARQFSLTALGRAGAAVPDRAGARAGDDLWLSGPVGDAGLGLQVRKGRKAPARHAAPLVEAYRRPRPDARLGASLAGHVHAMMDVSDGVLVDAARMAAASGVRAVIAADAAPLSPAFVGVAGSDLAARRFALSAGDDYVLLIAAPPAAAAALEATAADHGGPLYHVGRIEAGAGLMLEYAGTPADLPESLGYEH